MVTKGSANSFWNKRTNWVKAMRHKYMKQEKMIAHWWAEVNGLDPVVEEQKAKFAYIRSVKYGNPLYPLHYSERGRWIVYTADGHSPSPDVPLSSFRDENGEINHPAFASISSQNNSPPPWAIHAVQEKVFSILPVRDCAILRLWLDGELYEKRAEVGLKTKDTCKSALYRIIDKVRLHYGLPLGNIRIAFFEQKRQILSKPRKASRVYNPQKGSDFLAQPGEPTCSFESCTNKIVYQQKKFCRRHYNVMKQRERRRKNENS